MKTASESICVPSVEAPAAMAIENSYNTKLSRNRQCSSTSASQASCPQECPLLGRGCFAENWPYSLFTKLLNRSTITDPEEIAHCEARAIDGLTGRLPLRLHVVGDVTTEAGTHTVTEAAARYQARGGQPVWTYTHAWKRVSRAAFGSVQVLASCHSLAEARWAMNRGYAAALLVSDFSPGPSYPIGDGLRGIPCPEEAGTKPSCVDCQLCWHADTLRRKGLVILFRAHGSQKGRVRTAPEIIPVIKSVIKPVKGEAMASTLSANGHSPAKRAAPDLRTSDLRTSDPPSFAQSSFPQSSFPTLFRPGARIVIEEPRPDGGYACTTPSLDDLVAYVAACLGVRVAAARSVAAGPGKCGTCGRERSADRRGYLFCSWCRGAAIRNGKAAKKEARS